MKHCFFCDGAIDAMKNICIMCGRSTNIEHELYVKNEQEKKHQNLWNTYSINYYKKRKRRAA